MPGYSAHITHRPRRIAFQCTTLFWQVTLMIKSMPVPTLSKPPSTPTLPQICGLPLTPTYLETALHKTTSLVKKVDCGVDTVMSVSE